MQLMRIQIQCSWCGSSSNVAGVDPDIMHQVLFKGSGQGHGGGLVGALLGFPAMVMIPHACIHTSRTHIH